MNIYDPIHGPRKWQGKCPVSSTPTETLQKMTDAELRTRANKLHKLLSDMRSEEQGRPRWFRNIEQRRSERNAYGCEIRRINTILKYRQHAALEIGLDRDATADAVAG